MNATINTTVKAAVPQAHHMVVNRGSPFNPREPLVTGLEVGEHHPDYL